MIGRYPRTSPRRAALALSCLLALANVSWDQLEGTADPAERERIFRELIAIFQADVPVTVLEPLAWAVFAHRRLRGLSSPWRAGPLAIMDELWLEDGSQQ